MNKLYFKYLANNTFFLQNVAQYHFSNRNRIEREIMTYYDEIIDSIQASQKIEESMLEIQSIQDDVFQAWLDTMDDIEDKMATQVERYEQISNIIEHDKNVIQLDEKSNCFANFKKKNNITFWYSYRDNQIIFEGVSSEPMLDKDDVIKIDFNYNEDYTQIILDNGVRLDYDENNNNLCLQNKQIFLSLFPIGHFYILLKGF